MYTIKDKTYAEAGYILSSKRAIGMSLSNDFSPFTERLININNISIKDNTVSFDIFKWTFDSLQTYGNIKKYIIQKRYSNDNQIAIMLNKDNSEEDTIAYNKMQEYREWASVLAKKIIEVLNSNIESEEELILEEND